MMPKAMEHRLMMEARKKGMKGEHKNAFIYGTMRKMGWVPAREKKKHK